MTRLLLDSDPTTCEHFMYNSCKHIYHMWHVRFWACRKISKSWKIKNGYCNQHRWLACCSSGVQLFTSSCVLGWTQHLTKQVILLNRTLYNWISYYSNVQFQLESCHWQKLEYACISIFRPAWTKTWKHACMHKNLKLAAHQSCKAQRA